VCSVFLFGIAPNQAFAKSNQKNKVTQKSAKVKKFNVSKSNSKTKRYGLVVGKAVNKKNANHKMPKKIVKNNHKSDKKINTKTASKVQIKSNRSIASNKIKKDKKDKKNKLKKYYN
jgi:hypothetical protein